MKMPGAHPHSAGTDFVVHATRARDVAVRLFDERGGERGVFPLAESAPTFFEASVASARPGMLYTVLLDGQEIADPYARFLPRGVDGPARIVAPLRSPSLGALPEKHRWVLYELHVGTFSAEGTYRGAIAHLDRLVDLGVTAIELMPLASFAGRRGWGYDGVAPYAPFAPYGEPEDLRALLAEAHARGLAVVLDVVWSHLGPVGNTFGRFAPEYFTKSDTPWGTSFDFGYGEARALVLDNARHWLDEYGFDGLRLDATHQILDAPPEHVIDALCTYARSLAPPRAVFVEDERNDARFVARAGATAVWADDLHHQTRVVLTGERDGYYAAYRPEVSELARCVNEGWLYSGQGYAPWKGRPRGTKVGPLGPAELVTCIENHDQVGNRAFGTRLSHDVALDLFCAAATMLLFLPTTPLLFMGQEWAASSPFLYFTDHGGELGERISRGRREELKHFSAFADEARALPDPQAEETFLRSKLRWEERREGDHARALEVHRAMLALRRSDAVLSAPASFGDVHATAHGDVLEVVRKHEKAARRLVVNFGGAPWTVDLRVHGEVRAPLFQSGPVEDGRLLRGGALVLLG